jgi:hypothetical protein
MNALARMLLMVCLVLFILSSCSNRAPEELPKFESPNFMNTWLEVSCELPCWFGIVPGQTHLNEANNILNTIPEINYIESFTETEDANGNVRFDVTGGGYRIIGGMLVYNSDDEIIDSIQYFAGDSISLQDVIEVLGEPSYYPHSAPKFQLNNNFE